MDRTSRKSRTIGSKVFDTNCAQGMRCNPVPCIIRKRKQPRDGPIMQRLKFVQSIPKSDLPCGQFTPVASAKFIVHRQQTQSDPCLPCRRCNSLRRLGDVVIQHAAGLMIQIVRLSVGQIACFKHFQLHKCSDRLDVIQGQPVKDGGALACAREKGLKLPDILGRQSGASQ